jgi:hypothetical protein
MKGQNAVMKLMYSHVASQLKVTQSTQTALSWHDDNHDIVAHKKKEISQQVFDQYNHSSSEKYIMMDIHTIYMPCREEWTFLSLTVMKAALGGRMPWYM